MDEVMLKRLELIVNQIKDFTSKALGTEPSADDISSFSEAQLKAEEVLAELTTKIKRAKEDKIEKISISKGDNVALSSKLPKLNLPEFEGNILEWYQFWDQFDSNIGSRNLSDVDKLLYLKSSVKGDAKKTIEGLETTNKNYQIAVTTLKERYGKQTQIIDAHYAALYKIKAGKSTTEARNTLNEVEKHLRVLKSFGEDINHNHLRFLIMEKFPEDIIYEMKMKMSTESIEEMRKHLEIIISAREDASRITQENTTEGYTTQTLYVNSFNRNGKTKKENKPRKFIQNHQENKTHIFTHNQEKDKAEREYNAKKFGWMYKDKRDQRYKESHKKPLKRRSEEQEVKREVPERKRTKFRCIFCEGSHYNDQCQSVKTLKERKEKLRGRCYNCLRKGHSVKQCRKRVSCVHCQSSGKHNRALCPNGLSLKVETTNTLHTTGGSTILQTAVVKANIEGDIETTINCRVLLDTGSQRTYITQATAKKLNLPIEEESNLSVFTFGSKLPHVIKSAVVKVQLQTRTDNLITLFANVVPHISEGVPYPKNLTHWKDKTILADDGSLSSKIDILIGNDYYFTLISSGKIKLEDNLFLIESKLGWILTGKTNTKTVDDLSAITYFQAVENKLTRPDLPLDNGNLKCLWELESIGISDSPGAARDEETVKQFNETIELIDNRYTVSWPWLEYPPNLTSNFGLSFGRLINLLRRLDTETLLDYDKTLREQIEMGIVEIIPKNEKLITEINHPIHYLPHHGVSHPTKPTRIVYDASAKTKDNKSLNECLHCGPLMLEDLTGMLIRFRTHQIGITADVEKAFLQIALHNKDKDVTRFLWLEDITKPATENNLLHLRFCRVPFGIISSPFLLNATLKHHLSNSNQEVVKQIVNDIYVDNLVTGTESIEEAITMYKASKKAFQDISMNLREWSSNSKPFMETIPNTEQCKEINIKVLGLNWYLKNDTLQLKFKQFTVANTKRETLRIIASIYDPCGYAVPELLPAKIFLQKLWIQKIKWDTPLPRDLKDKWLEIARNLEDIKDILIPRRYFQRINNKEIQLHCFTDASTKAYAAVVYVTNGTEISFVIGKSRLVPIKDQENLQIPRLELLGVLIGSRLLKYVMKYFDLNFKQVTLWTDSQIVIDWYHTNKLLPPFITKRIQEIRQFKKLTIKYVPTNLNPADVATRPTATKEVREKWLSGANFLLDDAKTWLISHRSHNFLVGEGLTKEHNMMPITKGRTIPVEKGNKSKIKEDDIDMNATNIQEIKRIQEQYFSEEIKGKETNLSRNLGLFKDIDGILRCKGRLKNANWSFDKRYPILIPKECDFTEKLIQITHERNYHVGVNHTLSLIRQSHWIPQGRSQVQKILKKCTNCIKHGGGPFKLPPTPALPQERVNYSPPFTYTGIDYLGPVYVKTSYKEEKRWICLYTCLAVRAIHLEVVNDLTAEECLLALRRFIATRGVPDTIISDNALQFKLTSEILSNHYCINNKIKWKFIPQLAPWHGGFYERLVGLVKHCMKRTLTKQILNNNQLCTVIKEIEAVINTRPLTCVSSDLEDVLTPSDFLTLGKCLVTEPIEQEIRIDGTTNKQNLVEGWRRGQRMLKDFKKMFVDQYLPSLRERYQHSHKEPRILKVIEPKVGDIVQIKNDNKNRESWKVGKITYLLKGADGQCRVARVNVNGTEFTRSINHLYPLEIEHVPEREKKIECKQNSNPMLTDLPSKIVSNNENPHHAEITATRDTPRVEEEPEKTCKEVSGQPEVSDQMETLEELLPESLQIEIIPESPKIRKENSPNEKEVRNASIKAREKIREWTRDLMDLL